jgi:hypothetical protein
VYHLDDLNSLTTTENMKQIVDSIYQPTLAVEWPCTSNEKGKTTKTSTEIDVVEQRSRGRPRGNWKRTQKRERKDANRTGFELEKRHKIGLSSVSLFPPYVALGAIRID